VEENFGGKKVTLIKGEKRKARAVLRDTGI